MISQERYISKIEEYEKESQELMGRAKQFVTECNHCLDELTERLTKIANIQNKVKQLVETQANMTEREWALIENKMQSIKNYSTRLEKIKTGLFSSCIKMQEILQLIDAACQEKVRRKKLLQAAEMMLDNIH